MNVQSCRCSGCSSCVYVCPKKAIKIIVDSKGSFRASVDDNCVDCGLCLKVCPHNDDGLSEPVIHKVYGFRSNSNNALHNSQSGGAFLEIAKKILSINGVVYGVVFEDLNAKYFRAASKKTVSKMLRSKYLQPEIGDTFLRIKEDLVSGHPVLFSGVPCYVKGLLNYLRFYNINLSQLFTVDLICHGYPCNILFKDYISFYERKHKKNVKSVSFRDKKYGWHGYTMSIKDSYATIHNDEYTYIYYSNLGLIETCYSCKFSNLHRQGDITLGDYWGVEKYYPHLSDNKGVSLVLVNSRKGLSLFGSIRKLNQCFETSIDRAMQQNLHDPTPKPILFDNFWVDYEIFGIFYVMEKYCDCRKAPRNKHYDLAEKVLFYCKNIKKCARKTLRKIKNLLYG